VLLAYRRRRGRGAAPGDILRNLPPGIFLLPALRARCCRPLAPCLALALLAHLADLGRRWRG
jgi:hypothetical protein